MSVLNTYVQGGALFFPPMSPAIPKVKKLLRFPNPEYVQYLRLKERGKFIPKPPQYMYACREIPKPHPWAGGLAAPRYLDLEDVFEGEKVVRMTAPEAKHVFLGPGFRPRDYQEKAVELMLAFGGGFVVAPCVAGDTIINVNRAGKGFKIPIASLHEKFHAGRWLADIPTKVRSWKGGRIGIHEIRDVVYSGVKVTFVLTLSDGRTIRATQDHKVLTPRGWKQIGALVVGDEVIVDSGQKKWGKKESPVKPKPKPVYRRLSWYQSHPFAHKNGSWGGNSPGIPGVCLEEHRAIAEAHLNELSLEDFRARCKSGDIEGLKFIDPSKFHVHHRNGDHLDNRPENLEVLPISEHYSQHGDDSHFGYGAPLAMAVVSVEEHGCEPVYDIVCDEPYRNFVANGIVVHNCGSGKTSIGMVAITKYPTKTLVLVDTKDLARQWIDRCRTQLADPFGNSIEATLVGDGEFDDSGRVVVGLYQSILKMDFMKRYEWGRQFGLTIADECHICPARTFSDVLMSLPAKYRLGLTATPEREDGLTPLLYYHIGLKLLTIELEDLEQRGLVMLPRIERFDTGWSPPEKMFRVSILEDSDEFKKTLDGFCKGDIKEFRALLKEAEPMIAAGYTYEEALECKEKLEEMYLTPRITEDDSWVSVVDAMCRDRVRNAKWLGRVREAVRNGRQVLMLSPRVEHCIAMASAMQRMGLKASPLVGPMSKKKRAETLKLADNRELDVVTATQLADKGLDLPRLDTVAIVVPGKALGRLQQRIGRTMRPAPGKVHPLVIDAVDQGGAFEGLYQKRKKLYVKLGCRL